MSKIKLKPLRNLMIKAGVDMIGKSDKYSLGPVEMLFEPVVELAPGYMASSIAMPILGLVSPSPLELGVRIAQKLFPSENDDALKRACSIASMAFDAFTIGASTYGVGAVVVVGLFIIRTINKLEKETQALADAELDKKLEANRASCKEKARAHLQERWERRESIAKTAYLAEVQKERGAYRTNRDGVILNDLAEGFQSLHGGEEWCKKYWEHLANLRSSYYCVKLAKGDELPLSVHYQQYNKYLYYYGRYELAIKGLLSACQEHGDNCNLDREITSATARLEIECDAPEDDDTPTAKLIPSFFKQSKAEPFGGQRLNDKPNPFHLIKPFLKH